MKLEKEYNYIILKLLQLAYSFQTQMGLLQTKEEDYFIEPMARMERQPHLFYKRSTLLRLMSQNSSLSRGCALKSSFPQGTAVTSQMSFVTHSFPPRWGRNECVKNEPQRTSAGRLYCSYACSSRRSASKDGAKESVSSALHFAPNNPVIAERMEQANSRLQSLLEAQEVRAQASRRLWGREWEQGTAMQATCSLEFIY